MDLNDLDDAEKFQKHFVTPMVDAVREEIKPLVRRIEALEKLEPRIIVLEGYSKKILAVYSSIVGIASYVGHIAWLKLRAKF